MRFVSLFSGCDGLGLGLERAGMTCVAHAEINKHACKVLARHWPTVPNFGDVSDVSGRDFPDADGFVGGFPCPDISLAGNRAGLAGEHSGLWFQYARILDEARPSWCLIENVDALLSSNGGRDLGTILGTLGDLGYGYAFRVLDAQWAGVAQRRKRIFIVGSLGSVRAAEVLLEPEGRIRHRPPSRQEGAALTRRPAGRARAMRWREGKPGGGKGALVSEELSLTLATSNDQIIFHATQDPIWSREVSPALTANAYLGVSDGEVARRLTPRETERLQGFPDDWTRWGPDGEEIKDGARYAMTGNAVAVPVAEWIGKRIARIAGLRMCVGVDGHEIMEDEK